MSSDCLSDTSLKVRQGSNWVLSPVQDRSPPSVPSTAHATLGSNKQARQLHGEPASSQAWVRHSTCAYVHALGTLPAPRRKRKSQVQAVLPFSTRPLKSHGVAFAQFGCLEAWSLKPALRKGIWLSWRSGKNVHTHFKSLHKLLTKYVIGTYSLCWYKYW